MLARFFIDRPIFAWVVSLVILLLGGVSAYFLPIAQYPPITPPTIQVTALYPGANAREVADTIAAPIEQQVVGVENMMYMSSQSANDGSYTLTVTFEIGSDLDTAQVLVQNRVALALPQLPAQVQLQGVNTKKASPDILLAVSLVSPDGRYDELYQSNYATIHLQDELARIKGVGDIHIFGQRLYAMRIWLDPDRLTTRGLTAADVVNAIQTQNVQVAAGEIGQPPVPSGQRRQLTMSALGRLETVKQFGDIIVKAGQPAGASATAATSAQQSQSGSTAAAPDASGGTGASTTSTTTGPPTPGNPTSTPIVHLSDLGRIELGAQTVRSEQPA